METPSADYPSLHRRELLKVVAAGGGALAAAAFLPNKWTRPVINAGVLPAHAQATQCSELTITLIDACRYVPEGQCSGDDEYNFLIHADWSPATNDQPVSVILHWCGWPQQILYTTFDGGDGIFSSVDLEIANPVDLPCDTYPSFLVELWLTFENGCILYDSEWYST